MAKKWAQKVKIKKGALGPLDKVTVAKMMANPKIVQRVSFLANVGQNQAKALMSAYNQAKRKQGK